MLRTIHRIVHGQETFDGAGVKLRRVFGFSADNAFDPFLLLDDFGADRPEDFMAGFPWHPHRGIETVTWMLDGRVAHGDSLGNEGVIGPGEMQWMSAGSGIIHQEMPERGEGRLRGLQLWVNLPSTHKMSPPRYRGISPGEVPRVTLPGGGSVLVLAGTYGGVTGPVRDVVASPRYLDVTLPAGGTFTWDDLTGLTVFAYVIEGAVGPAPENAEVVRRGSAALFSAGEALQVTAGADGARMVLVAGAPLREPVAWRGPIVMNTQQELDLAFREFHAGTFVK
ncbi:pirin family protein [Myxococcota bacterium]|nr:pirin family protein [Myxococcota bacterium]MBU1412505.1 pirin family protein [Myxococcota bacterium]MBU1510410.1 pirin family protein [Myxococcota bacterium]